MKKILTVIAIGFLCSSMFSALAPNARAFPGFIPPVIEKLSDNIEDDFGPSIRVDSIGRPHIAWVRGAPSAYDIYYGVRTGSSWSISKVASITASSAFHLSLCLDSNDNPHIAALTETSRWELWYIYWSESLSGWVVESVANGGSQSHRNVVSLALDSSNSPHIAWAARWGGGLWGIFYAAKSGAGWSIETVSHDDDTAPSIALDSNGDPHVLWNHYHYCVNPRLQYASRISGAWVVEDVPGGEYGDTNNPRQLVIDSFDVPHIAFSKVPSTAHSELWYGNKTLGSWALTRIKDSTFNNFYSSLSLGASEIPYIAFMSNEAGNYDVYLTTMVEGSWDVIQVTHDLMDEGNNPGPSLCVDSANNAHLVWYAPQIGSDEAEIYYGLTRLQPSSALVNIDPDTLNLESNGQWITAYITLPEGYNVEDIVLETVCLDGIAASWSEIQDGVYMAKFDRATVQNRVTDEPDYESAPKFYDIVLAVTGQLADGTAFEGSDTIRIISK